MKSTRLFFLQKKPNYHPAKPRIPSTAFSTPKSPRRSSLPPIEQTTPLSFVVFTSMSLASRQHPKNSLPLMATSTPPSTGSFPHPATANTSPASGSTSPATPTPPVINTIKNARCGPGGIGWSMPSTQTCHSINSRSNKSPAIYWKIPPNNNVSPPASTATIQSPSRAA